MQGMPSTLGRLLGPPLMTAPVPGAETPPVTVCWPDCPLTQTPLKSDCTVPEGQAIAIGAVPHRVPATRAAHTPVPRRSFTCDSVSGDGELKDADAAGLAALTQAVHVIGRPCSIASNSPMAMPTPVPNNPRATAGSTVDQPWKYRRMLAAMRSMGVSSRSGPQPGRLMTTMPRESADRGRPINPFH